MVLFEDLKVLSEADIKQVMLSVGRDVLSTSLIGAAPEVYQHFDRAMSGSLREMVQEFIKLRGDSMASREIEAAQDLVLTAALKLDQDGKIRLRELIG